MLNAAQGSWLLMQRLRLIICHRTRDKEANCTVEVEDAVQKMCHGEVMRRLKTVKSFSDNMGILGSFRFKVISTEPLLAFTYYHFYEIN